MIKISWASTGQLVEQWRVTVEQAIGDAAAYINAFLARPIDFDVSVSFASLDGAIATGGSDVTHVSGADWEPVGAYQSRTGAEASGYDAIITYDSNYLARSHFGSSSVPSTMIDGFSVLVHEMLHGVGFTGWTDWTTYQNTVGAYTPFDRHIQVQNGEPYFSGVNVDLLAGGPVLLESGNLFHLSDGEHHLDIMNPYAPMGERFAISDLDLAILADFGIGTVRDDILYDTAGADNIAGGAGLDRVIYGGRLSDYSIEVQGLGRARIGLGAAADQVTSVERLEFLDGTLALDLEGNVGQIYRLYQAAFERSPDAKGLSYWIGRLDSGDTSLKAIADSFIHSPEFVQTFGTEETVSSDRFVDLLYLHTLGREYEQEGFNYWVDRLENGETNRSDLLAFFSESDENQTGTAAETAGGIWYV